MNLSLSCPPLRNPSFTSCRYSLLLSVLLIGVGAPAFAQGTRLWTQSRLEEFEKGTPQGVAIGSDGKLRGGPIAAEVLTTPSSFVWSVAVDKAGIAYVTTGAPATVLRVSPDKTADPRFTKLLETKALAVQVIRLGPDGALYAATIPDGKVYRLKPDATAPVDEASAQVIFDLSKVEKVDGDKASADGKKPEDKSHYIWDMTFDSAGRLYVATGGPGAVYRLNVKEAQPKAELFFKTDEQHLRALTWDKSGNLLAGSDGSGLVYRIDPNGKGYVLFSAPRREITALAVGADGTIYAADVGDKNRNPLPQLPVQAGAGGITITFVNPASVQAANASTALPDGTEVYALIPNQAPRKLWSDKDDIVYQLAATADGVTALTGNRGRIFTIHPDGSYSDLAHLEAQQAVSMLQVPGGLLVGTGNTGKLYAMSNFASAAAEQKAAAGAGIRRYASYIHSYASDVLDAGALARWGRVEVDPGSRGYHLWTRSGNVEQPVRSAKDWGWSDWQPATDGKVASPPGRYLQWKVELDGDALLSGVGINYLPVNSAPAVDDVLVAPGARFTPQPQQNQPPTVTIAFPNPAQSGAGFDGNAATQPIQAQKDRTAVTVRWNAHDDNGDDLTYDLYLRGDGEHVWRLLKKGLTDKVYSFDGATFPDGGYEIKVVASDAPSHTPGDALTGELVSDRFELDTTAPVISSLTAGRPLLGECKPLPCTRPLTIPVSFDARDATSPVTHAEYSLDAGPWQYVEPVDGLSDSKEERYSFAVPLPIGPDGKVDAAPEHLISVRAYDRHDNMGTGKIIVPGSVSDLPSPKEK